jgi:pyruvate/2-oxoglutarate/acetoin dehydrogenase E1 component
MPLSVVESLNSGLNYSLSADDRVLLMGEDMIDPYGGAFKVTKGLSTLYPQRVLNTPISEGGLVGLGAGMALRGLRPVVEIMFGDFITLAADALTNTLSKYPWMYAGQVQLPLVIRTPMGGRRGYGPTHSQSLEKMVMAIPGIRVLAPVNLAHLAINPRYHALGSPGALLAWAILEQDTPTVFIENKVQYPAALFDEDSLNEFDVRQIGNTCPTIIFNIRSAPAPVATLAAYGGMVDLAREAMLKLAYEEEIFTQLIVPTQLSPFNVDPFLDSVSQTQRLITIEEGTLTLGWGAEIVSRVSEKMGGKLIYAHRLAAPDQPIPASRIQEENILPGVTDMIQLVKSILKNV